MKTAIAFFTFLLAIGISFLNTIAANIFFYSMIVFFIIAIIRGDLPARRKQSEKTV